MQVPACCYEFSPDQYHVKTSVGDPPGKYILSPVCRTFIHPLQVIFAKVKYAFPREQKLYYGEILLYLLTSAIKLHQLWGNEFTTTRG